MVVSASALLSPGGRCLLVHVLVAPVDFPNTRWRRSSFGAPPRATAFCSVPPACVPACSLACFFLPFVVYEISQWLVLNGFPHCFFKPSVISQLPHEIRIFFNFRLIFFGVFSRVNPTSLETGTNAQNRTLILFAQRRWMDSPSWLEMLVCLLSELHGRAPHMFRLQPAKS